MEFIDKERTNFIDWPYNNENEWSFRAFIFLVIGQFNRPVFKKGDSRLGVFDEGFWFLVGEKLEGWILEGGFLNREWL
jgi:hypothetical protein